MTTFAISNRHIAADSALSHNDYIVSHNCKKIYVTKKFIFAQSGVPHYFKPLTKTIKKKFEIDPALDFDGHLLVYVKKECRWYEFTAGHAFPMPVKPPFATGSGEIPAYAALLAGASAKRAVEIAAEMDGGTGGRITSVRYR